MTKLYVVATPIGNLADICERARQVLNDVSWIASEDTRHSKKLLQHLQISTSLYAYHQHNETQVADQFVEWLRAGQSGALVSDAGTPCISDPGAILVKQARASGIQVVSVPGASSVVAALSICGFFVNQFTFYGFLPAKASSRMQCAKETLEQNGLKIFFETPHRIKHALGDLMKIYGDDCELFIARELTKIHEQSFTGTFEAALSAIESGVIPEKGEFVLIVNWQGAGKGSDTAEIQKVLKLLLPSLSIKEAVRITVELTQAHKNLVYQTALALKDTP